MAGDCERLRKSGTCLDRFGAGNFHGEIVRTQSGNAISSRFNEISIEYSRSLFVPRLFSLFFSPSFVEMENPIRRASERQMCLPIQQKGSQFEESSERKKSFEVCSGAENAPGKWSCSSFGEGSLCCTGINKI